MKQPPQNAECQWMVLSLFLSLNNWFAANEQSLLWLFEELCHCLLVVAFFSALTITTTTLHSVCFPEFHTSFEGTAPEEQELSLCGDS